MCLSLAVALRLPFFLKLYPKNIYKAIRFVSHDNPDICVVGEILYKDLDASYATLMEIGYVHHITSSSPQDFHTVIASQKPLTPLSFDPKLTTHTRATAMTLLDNQIPLIAIHLWTVFSQQASWDILLLSIRELLQTYPFLVLVGDFNMSMKGIAEKLEQADCIISGCDAHTHRLFGFRSNKDNILLITLKDGALPKVSHSCSWDASDHARLEAHVVLNN